MQMSGTGRLLIIAKLIWQNSLSLIGAMDSRVVDLAA
jgi:hypothetical protein